MFEKIVKNLLERINRQRIIKAYIHELKNLDVNEIGQPKEFKTKRDYSKYIYSCAVLMHLNEKRNSGYTIFNRNYKVMSHKFNFKINKYPALFYFDRHESPVVIIGIFLDENGFAYISESWKNIKRILTGYTALMQVDNSYFNDFTNTEYRSIAKKAEFSIN